MTAPTANEHRHVLVATAVILAWLAATAWARPLMLPDEGRYVGVAWEMLRSGDWLTPTLNGLPYFHKPPLFYWITAASMSTFGINVWSARAAPMLGATLGALATWLFVRRWSGEHAARHTLMVLLAQPLFFVGAQFANLDMLVAGCLSATILALAHGALSAERQQDSRFVVRSAYALAALGVLAKGLIGIVIPVLVVGVWMLVRRQWRVVLALWSWPGVALFALIAAPWFVAMQQRFPDFLDYFFVVQHFKRFAAGGFNNVQPFWFYAALLAAAFLFWLPWQGRWFQRDTWSTLHLHPIRLLMAVWAAAVVLFFSLPASKLVGYVLPAMAPLAYLMSDGLQMKSANDRRARARWLVATGMAAVLGWGSVAWLATHHDRSTQELAQLLREGHRDDEPVVMLNDYYFDVPLMARLRRAAVVVDDWSAAKVNSRDNWRKELADAGHFDTVRAQTALIDAAALPTLVCRSPVTWLLGPDDSRARFPFLAAATVVGSVRGDTLWRFQPGSTAGINALDCAGTPNVGSASK
jgi:4-amino-4-deoxy-L-arabinose transferase-like glycosyltransferase